MIDSPSIWWSSEGVRSRRGVQPGRPWIHQISSGVQEGAKKKTSFFLSDDLVSMMAIG